MGAKQSKNTVENEFIFENPLLVNISILNISIKLILIILLYNLI